MAFGYKLGSNEDIYSTLVHLVERLNAGGFRLLDTQFNTTHLSQFGAIEVPKAEYEHLLTAALAFDADFYALDRKNS